MHAAVDFNPSMSYPSVYPIHHAVHQTYLSIFRNFLYGL